MPDNNKMENQIKEEVIELAGALNGLMSNFNKLRAPLVESHDQVPQATDQLDKISEQTEKAAQQMLDVVESITQREEEVVANLDKIKALAEESKNTELITLAGNASAKAQLNLDDAFTMLDALQFQDITSQQMDHAASLLEDIETKLNGILSLVGHKQSENVDKKKRERAYDPHADMYDKKTDQNDIDSIFEAQGSGDS